MRRILVLVAGQLSVGALLFLAAGTLRWGRGWVFLAAWMGQMLAMRLVVAWRAPGLLNVRGTRQAGTKAFDPKLLRTYYLLVYLFPVAAGLDHRYGWLPLPVPTVVVGLACVLSALVLGTWAMLSNPHFEATVRIQRDRGHTVVQDGPYRFVRHPGYLASIVQMSGLPLILGSGAAVLPAALMVAVFVTRTALEDRVLREELEGYADYARRTRHRLLPAVW